MTNLKIGDEINYKGQLYIVFHIFPKIKQSQPILIGANKHYLTVDISELHNSTSLKKYYKKPTSTMSKKQQNAIKLCETYGAPKFKGKTMLDVTKYLNLYLDDAKKQKLDETFEDMMNDIGPDPYDEAGFN